MWNVEIRLSLSATSLSPAGDLASAVGANVTGVDGQTDEDQRQQEEQQPRFRDCCDQTGDQQGSIDVSLVQFQTGVQVAFPYRGDDGRRRFLRRGVREAAGSSAELSGM